MTRAQTPWFRFGSPDEFRDESEEIVPHPGNPDELEAVGALVESQPETKLRGTELVGSFHGKDIRADQIDGVSITAGRWRLFREHQFVLAQHLACHHPEQCPRLDCDCPTSHRLGEAPTARRSCLEFCQPAR